MLSKNKYAKGFERRIVMTERLSIRLAKKPKLVTFAPICILIFCFYDNYGISPCYYSTFVK